MRYKTKIMKQKIKLIYYFAILSVVLSSCLKDECTQTQTFTQYNPIYKSLTQIRSEFNVQAARPIQENGKIYIYKDYLLINEPKLGIHIFDNTDQKNPQALCFLFIPGNVDLAVRNDILYADNYIDLISIDISDPRIPKLICRDENLFSPLGIDPTRGIFVDYEKTRLTRTLSCSDPNFGSGWFREGDIFFGSESTSKNSGSGGNGNVVGTGGSQARFTITDDYLYTIDNFNLYSFSLTGKCPELLFKNTISWDIETIYPYEGKLFIGSQSGIYIFELMNPAQPTYAGELKHIRTCDPVVTEGNIAYVSLHGGSPCGGYSNQLDIVDVSNIYNPVLLKTYAMKSPTGLAIYENKLYLCDDGIKLFDASKPMDLQLKSRIQNISAYDVIYMADLKSILISAENGIYQYNVSNIDQPNFISKINVQ